MTLDEIDRLLLPRIADLVDAVTRREGEQYADFIGRVIEAGPDAIRIKMADVEDNMRNGSEGRRLRYSKAYERLRDAL